MRTRVPSLLANLLILGVPLLAAALQAWDPEAYYLGVQEDEVLEWSTFWAFLVAAGFAVQVSLRDWRASRRLPWFILGVGAFCLWVAMEEISWGQRVIGYRPPSYFLEHNYQQELNVHNVVGKDLRQLALKAVILGYGVVLPLAGLLPASRRLLARLGVVITPAALIPAFLATYLLYELYPWDFSGEWVELMLGLGFLFAIVLQAAERDRRRDGRAAAVVWLAASCVFVAGAGLVNATWSRAQRQAHPQTLAAAQIEVDALSRDFQEARIPTRCGLHKRIYTFVHQQGADALSSGTFAALEEQGLPEERSRFFLDPWNSPYWIRDSCGEDRRRRLIFIYSLGPDRKRNSTDWEIRADDVGSIVFEASPGP